MAEIWAGLYSLAAQRGDTGMSYVGRNESRTPAIQGVGLSAPTNYTNIMATLPQPPAWITQSTRPRNRSSHFVARHSPAVVACRQIRSRAVHGVCCSHRVCPKSGMADPNRPCALLDRRTGGHVNAERIAKIIEVEQLSRIPAGTVVVSDEGGVFEKDSDGRWLEPGNSWKLTNNDLALPVRVLYTPGGE